MDRDRKLTSGQHRDDVLYSWRSPDVGPRPRRLEGMAETAFDYEATRVRCVRARRVALEHPVQIVLGLPVFDDELYDRVEDALCVRKQRWAGEAA